MTVKRLLAETDSQELAEWWAFDQRWPLPDHWQQTARLCRIVMCASGNYKKNDIPDEAVFIPATRKLEQTQDQIIAELLKLQRKPGDDIDERV
jgi:hypothetical protein